MARLRLVEQLVPLGSWLVGSRLVKAVEFEDGLSLFSFMRPIFFFGILIGCDQLPCNQC
jgi:hypothetical protein